MMGTVACNAQGQPMHFAWTNETNMTKFQTNIIPSLSRQSPLARQPLCVSLETVNYLVGHTGNYTGQARCVPDTIIWWEIQSHILDSWIAIKVNIRYNYLVGHTGNYIGELCNNQT